MIYFVNPSERRILDNAGDRLPNGLLMMGTLANQKGYDVKIFDFNHVSEEEFYKSFDRDKPEAVGISVYTSPLYERSVKIAKKLKGKTRLIAGGYHASAMPETLENYFDAIVVGEGERGLFRALNEDGVIRDDGIVDLDGLPQLDYSLLDMDKYNMRQDGKRTGTIISSRGCPNKCAMCYNLSRNLRWYPLENIKGQMDDLKSLGFEALYFLDDVFTFREDRMKEIVGHAYFKGLPFRATTRADLIDESKMRTLSENGCEWSSFGIESGNDNVLKRTEKKMTTEINENAVRLANDYGVKSKGFFIIGLPGETEKTARDTIDFSLKLREIGLRQADFYYLTPFPGTPIWDDPKKFGLTITDRDFTKYIEAGAGARCYVETEGLSSGRIEELIEEARNLWE